MAETPRRAGPSFPFPKGLFDAVLRALFKTMWGWAVLMTGALMLLPNFYATYFAAQYGKQPPVAWQWEVVKLVGTVGFILAMFRLWFQAYKRAELSTLRAATLNRVLYDYVDTTLTDLSFGPESLISPTEKYRQSREAFDQLVDSLLKGGRGSIVHARKLGETFRNASRAMYASSVSFHNDSKYVLERLAAVPRECAWDPEDALEHLESVDKAWRPE